jgi:hypothetical protein
MTKVFWKLKIPLVQMRSKTSGFGMTTMPIGTYSIDGLHDLSQNTSYEKRTSEKMIVQTSVVTHIM